MTFRSRISSVASWVALVAVATLLGLGLLALVLRVSALDSALLESRSDRRALHSELDDRKAESQALADQVERLGGKPVVDPGEPAAPIPGPVFATQAQVNEAVSVICAGTSSCRPTEAQVKTTLRAICGDCRGDDGKDAEPAKDGTDGQDATISAEQIDAAVARNCGEDGCRGPGPTDQQLDERIAAYCSQGTNCKGESVKGDKGEPGSVTPGDYACPDGEYVTKISVTAEGSMVLACATPSLLRQP